VTQVIDQPMPGTYAEVTGILPRVEVHVMSEAKFSGQMLLPEILAQYPAARVVFDRYGLKGCGGPEGPRETLAWFAGLHGVDLQQLVSELETAALEGPAKAPAVERSIADSIYRSFFLGAIGTVLSLGCVWGAINLFLIGKSRNFSGVNYSWVLAHAHAMVFAFVGLFVMGFAYQAFPRFKHTSLWKPRLAFSALPLMLVGIATQVVAHLMAPNPPFLLIAVAASIPQMLAVGIFALVIIKTARSASKPERYDAFVYSSLAWFAVAAVANPVIFWLFEGASSTEQFVRNLASFNIPYRDVELIGFAVMMILGVSQRFLPHAYAMREPSDRWRKFLLWGVNGALAFGILFYIGGFTYGNPWLLLAYEASAFVLLIAAIGMPRQLRLFGKVPELESDRGLKFIRAAYVWFIIAMVMLVLAPAYNVALYLLTGSGFSHAYFGGYRHALTVGFILMMIVGVSSKVVPTLSGVDLRKAPSLWLTFVLLNAGNALRVSTQIATDFVPSAYGVMGLSGFIEVIGLSLWGYELFRNIRHGVSLERAILVKGALAEPLVITPKTKVAEVLECYPGALDIFLERGFTPLANPVLRKTMARAVTLEQACRRENIDLQNLISTLQSLGQSREGKAGVIAALPVLDSKAR
jgi:hypothetical protein